MTSIIGWILFYKFQVIMGFLTNTIKWSAKLGVGGGALYLVNQKNLFGNVDQAENGVKEMQILTQACQQCLKIKISYQVN